MRETGLFVGTALLVGLSACGPSGGGDTGSEVGESVALAAGSDDYCALPSHTSPVELVRPAEGEEPIDDVNWFSRPVPHDGTDHIVAFATHDQNHLYNLTTGNKIRIPDRSDAVATPDGRYMTVPSYYTPDSNTRFYPTAPLLEALERGVDADDTEPAFIHVHEAMKRVYYQSTAVLSEEDAGDDSVTTYRMMFSGTNDESAFRIVDYRFRHDGATGELVSVQPTEPMALCPAVVNDLNTPFISKDGRYVAAYTSESAEASFTPGSSLKIFEITGTDPAAGTTTCRQVVDLGFAAGKADFSYDASMLTFHISQGAYLTPFVNGGLPSTTITDVVVAKLARDDSGAITGLDGLTRLTTSLEAGVGSYFPAFFPDGKLFYIANAVPRDSEEAKRFHFRVMDPGSGSWRASLFDGGGEEAAWRSLAEAWERMCVTERPELGEAPFPWQRHESPWFGLSLTENQCNALVDDGRSRADSPETDWDALEGLCRSLAP